MERTQHVKVWMSFAQFELTLAALQQEDSSLPVEAARGVFQRANKFDHHIVNITKFLLITFICLL